MYAGRPFALGPLVEGMSREGLGACFREEPGDPVWSNFFLRSFTLVGKAGAPEYPLFGPDACLDKLGWRLSTGFDAERIPALSAAGTNGCFGVVPLPLDRNEVGG